MIESPALRANHPRFDARIRDGEPDPAGDFYPPMRFSPENAVVVAAQPGGARSEAVRPAGAGRRGAPVDYAIITLAPSAFAPSPGRLSDMAPTEAEPEVEAIMALRPQSYTTSFDQLIAKAARAHHVDPLLLHAVIKQESNYRPRAVSHAGARGLMQVMPATGRGLGVADSQHLFNAEVNIAAGAKLLSVLWQRFDGDIDLVLAAYNAGEGAVLKHGRKIPPYRETRDYVAKIKENYQRLAGESGIVVQF